MVRAPFGVVSGGGAWIVMGDKIRVLEKLGDMPLWTAASERSEGKKAGLEPVEPVMPVEAPVEAGARRIGLFVDAENVRLGMLGDVIEGLMQAGEVRVRRAYGQWGMASSREDAEVHVRHAVELRQCPRLTQTGKNAADIAMVVEVMDVLSRDEVDVFAVVSSDSDFTPLVQHLKRAGKEVWGYGLASAPDSLRMACGRFEEIGGAEGGGDDGVDEKLWAVLRKVVWQTKQKKSEGWKMLTEVGSALAEEGVSAGDLGYGTLSEACRKRSEFELHKDDGSGGYLVRLRDRSSDFSAREETLLKGTMRRVEGEKGWVNIADLAKALRDDDSWDFWKHQGRLKRRLRKLAWVEVHGTQEQLVRVRE